MKKSAYFLNNLLAVVLGLALLASVLVSTFLPAAVLPHLDSPAMTLVSLTALLAEYCLTPGAKRRYPMIFLFSALTFGLLPPAAGMTGTVWKTALTGGIVFTTVTGLFTATVSRISSGVSAKAAPVIGALGIFLAAQGFAGMIL